MSVHWYKNLPILFFSLYCFSHFQKTLYTANPCFYSALEKEFANIPFSNATAIQKEQIFCWKSKQQRVVESCEIALSNHWGHRSWEMLNSAEMKQINRLQDLDLSLSVLQCFFSKMRKFVPHGWVQYMTNARKISGAFNFSEWGLNLNSSLCFVFIYPRTSLFIGKSQRITRETNCEYIQAGVINVWLFFP